MDPKELREEMALVSGAYGLIDRRATAIETSPLPYVDEYTAPEDLRAAEKQRERLLEAYGLVARDLYNYLNGSTGLKAKMQEAVEGAS